jgi:hypothetical protein
VKHDNYPVSGLHVFLYPSQDVQDYPCDIKTPFPNHPMAGEKEYLCYTMTNNEGKYSFNKVHHGKYHVVIRSYDERKQMKIENDKIDVVVNHQSFSSETNLEISQFTISGKVVDSKKNPIKNIDITIDGKKITQSDSNGDYHLRNIKPGTYTLEASHKHIFFEPIHNLKISIWLDNLPELVLSYLHLCGKVNFNFGGSPQEAKRIGFSYNNVRVFLQSKREGRRSTVLNKDGTYCFGAKPGNYDIYSQTQKSSLSLRPK